MARCFKQRAVAWRISAFRHSGQHPLGTLRRLLRYLPSSLTACIACFALEERWLNTKISPDRDAHVREHTHLIELTVELYMNFMTDDRLTCASIRRALEGAILPHIVTRDRALLQHHHTVAP